MAESGNNASAEVGGWRSGTGIRWLPASRKFQTIKLRARRTRKNNQAFAANTLNIAGHVRPVRRDEVGTLLKKKTRRRGRPRDDGSIRVRQKNPQDRIGGQNHRSERRDLHQPRAGIQAGRRVVAAGNRSVLVLDNISIGRRNHARRKTAAAPAESRRRHAGTEEQFVCASDADGSAVRIRAAARR